MNYFNDKRWSGSWHIINTATGESLESWNTESRAKYFCESVNEHETRNGRLAVYVVENRETK